MAKEIDSEKVCLTEALEEFWYTIPDYQRPYVWDEEQIIELLDCIKNAMKSDSNSEYFIGSMVFRTKEIEENGTNYQECELLDGQQRITTLFLITAVIRDIVKDNEKDKETIRKNCNKVIFQEEDRYSNIPERIRIKFGIREQVNKFVNEYVKKDKGTEDEFGLEKIVNDKNLDLSMRNMAKAILIIRNYFKTRLDIIPQFYSFLKNKVIMVYIATEDLNDAFQLFTVMNNTGVKLRNSDILKANNLEVIEDEKKRKEKAKKWEEIESYFGDKFDNFLSIIRTILVKKKANYNLLKEYNDNIYEPKEYDRETQEYKKVKPLLQRGEQTFETIEKYYKIYVELFDKINEPDPKKQEMNNYLILMENGFEADIWIAPVLEFYNKFKENRLVDFIKSIDRKFSADWINSLTPTDRIENINKIIKKIEESNSPEDIIESQFLKFDYENLKRIVKGNIYGRKYAKYILIKLNLLEGNPTTQLLNIPHIISVEHILPQNPRVDSEWSKDFLQEEREELTDRLGNLMLISRKKNSSLGNLDYNEKREKYFSKNIEVLPQSVGIYMNNIEWKKSNLENNQHEMEGVLLKEYCCNKIDEEYKDVFSKK